MFHKDGNFIDNNPMEAGIVYGPCGTAFFFVNSDHLSWLLAGDGGCCYLLSVPSLLKKRAAGANLERWH